MDTTAQQPKRGIFVLAGFFGMFFLGILYAWSIIKVPISQQFSWTPKQMALVYSLSMCFFCAGSIFCAIVRKKLAPRQLLLIAAVLCLLGFGSTALQQGSYVLLCAGYGAAFGAGVGIAYNTLITVVTGWFPEKRGTVSGLLMMGFGFSTLILGRGLAAAFKSGMGWHKPLLTVAVVLFLVLVACALVLKRPNPPKKAGAANVESEGYTFKETMKRPSYWIFYLYGLAGTAIGSTVIGFARDLALNLGAEEAMAATLVGLLSIFNGGGRILCGFGYDKLGRRMTMFIATIITMLTPILMIFALQHGILALGVISLCLTGIAYGSVPTITSVFVLDVYGQKDFALNYSIANTKLLISSFAATIAGSLYESTGSFIAPFYMLTGLSVLTLILFFMLKKP